MSLSWLSATLGQPYPCGAARAIASQETRVDCSGPATSPPSDQGDVRSLPAFSHRARGKAGTDFIRQILDLAFGWRTHIRDRRRLTELSDHLLDDIGVSRADIEREPSSSFWRVKR